MTTLAFAFDLAKPARCVTCGHPTFRRVTREEGQCLACEDAAVKQTAAA